MGTYITASSEDIGPDSEVGVITEVSRNVADTAAVAEAISQAGGRNQRLHGDG
jgi:hypothetical protein